MCGHTKTSQPVDILEDVARLASERKRRRRQTQREQVASGGADLHAVDAKDPVAVAGWIGFAYPVAVIREHDKPQACPGCDCRDLLWRAVAVGAIRVDVHRSWQGTIVEGCGWDQARWGQCETDQNSNGGHEGRRLDEHANHSVSITTSRPT
jgi:hypothetical protein